MKPQLLHSLLYLLSWWFVVEIIRFPCKSVLLLEQHRLPRSVKLIERMSVYCLQILIYYRLCLSCCFSNSILWRLSLISHILFQLHHLILVHLPKLLSLEERHSLACWVHICVQRPLSFLKLLQILFLLDALINQNLLLLNCLLFFLALVFENLLWIQYLFFFLLVFLW